MTPKDAKVIEIQKLAYQIYLQRCRDGRPGTAEDDWLQACEQINKKYARNGSPEEPKAPAEPPAAPRYKDSEPRSRQLEPRLKR